MSGGNRGLWALRVPFEHLGARLYPDMFSLAQAHKAFNPEGRIADGQLQQRFDTNIINFVDLVEASTHYPCVNGPGWSTSASTPNPHSTGSSDRPGSAAGGLVTRLDAALAQEGVQPLQLRPEPPGLVGQ